MDIMLTVKKLADYAGVSVRTLHYYDQIGLLKPVSRTSKGYRYYGMDAVAALQQILFFRELQFSLEEIKSILTRPDFDMLEALNHHKTLLSKKKKRINELLATLDATIESKKEEMEMDITEYYRGFSNEKIEAYREEVRQRWGKETLAESEARILNMGKKTFIDIQAEGGQIFKTIYSNMSLGYKSAFIQEQVELWRQWLEHFHHYTDEEVLGLGKAYSQNTEFALFFHQYDENLPEFLTKAIKYYISKKKPK
ncbi:MAG: MerR family transcriptional regulator [Dehalococcoidales bacterium]|nr:MerR family transcriptional regulator [Dehalococcoidales bacterium]